MEMVMRLTSTTVAIAIALSTSIPVFGSMDADAQIGGRLRERLAARTPAAVGVAEQKLQFGGMERSYSLLAPQRGHGPAPLVIVLHGGGGSPDTMITRWSEQARTSGLIVVAPKGIGRNDRMGTWNASGCCGEAVTRGVDDVAFIAAVIDDVSRQRSVDPRRIYVTGFSNGGMLTHRVAIALGDKIAAAAVVSGALFGNETPPRTPVPMLIMHGEQDLVVAFGGGISPTGFVARAQTLPFLPVRSSVDFWRSANGCSRPPVVSVLNPSATEETSTGCRANADVVFYDLPQGDHSWPGTPGRGSDGRVRFGTGSIRNETASASTLNATALIWDFFQRHPRGGVR